MKVSYFVYILLCAIVGVTSVKAGLYFNDWQYWVILGCVIGAYICGDA